MVTPFGWLASRISLERRSLRAASLTAMIAAILIIVGGGVVRVTGSGLGCPDWPACTDGSLAPTAQMGIHATIEFANRLLTTVLCAAVGWVIIAARLQREPVPAITRWAWVQFWLVVLNAVIGGVTVWVKLNPFMVAGHFLAATLLLTAAAITWDKTQNLITGEHPASTGKLKALGTIMLAANAVLVIAGTAVTGSGPHAGDSADVPRMGFDWLGITVFHALVAVLALATVVVMWRTANQQQLASVSRKAKMYVLVFAGQGLIGIVQALTHLPELLVVCHLVGSALVWIGAIRLLLASHAPQRSAAAAAHS
ncbi:cytochrome oxidase assembly protein [Glutamicibacter halophytocola]|uniref:COX15/CtaA family protein n=1 Tax=Glutamicibacter halophytocola TaxID=1933880 RepID=UPI0006D4A69D|nr:COX15/CtaA family protein [Glutamicibacter halophytocola]ALG28291.1 cytochrome oxidase assembly protein [Glutamicibacter halophytocola]